MTTVNISIPDNMYNEAKKLLAKRGYASLSELVRDTLRKTIYPGVTENGFTPEFEDMVLEADKEPVDKSKVWKSERDIDNYFKKLKKRTSARFLAIGHHKKVYSK